MLDQVFSLINLLLLPLSLAVMLFATTKRSANYSPLTYWISNLGESNTKSHKYFSLSLVLLALSIISFGFILYPILPQGAVIVIFYCLIGLSVISLIGVIAFPLNSQLVMHMRSTEALFFSLIGFNLLILYLANSFSIIPYKITTLVILSTLFSLLFAVTTTIKNIKYGVKQLNMVKIRPVEPSFFVKNCTLWEWCSYISTLVWIFVFLLYVK